MGTHTPTESARLLDIVAVATMLDVSRRHVYRLAGAGRMPRPTKLGGAARWECEANKSWIDAGCQTVDARQGGRK